MKTELSTIDDSIRIEENKINESSTFVHDKEEEKDDNFDQIELKIEKDEIINKEDFSILTMINKSPRRIGNTYAFYYNSEGDPLIVIGPHWPFFVCLTSLICFIGYIFFYFLWEYLDPSVLVLGFIIFSIQLGSYSYTFLRNPGLPKKNMNINLNHITGKDGIKICELCHYIIDLTDNTTHCEECNVCIVGKRILK
jgi:hypothetical protein